VESNSLIQPKKSGTKLIEEILNSKVGSGVAVCWLGQSGYAFKTNQVILYIDLYLSEHLTSKYQNTSNPHVRITTTPLRGNQIEEADLILSTHKHSDHMDPLTIPDIMKNCKNAKYIVPVAHMAHVTDWGIDATRIHGARVDEKIEFGDVTIIPQPAKHENFNCSESQGYPHMSYIIQAGGIVFYHSGDTIPFNGMIEILKKHNVDVVMLPINGRDKRRHSYGTPGNCTIEEALCIAELSGAKCLIPHHYDMFTFNTVDIGEFKELAEELYPHLSCCILKCGEIKIFIKERGEVTWEK